MATAQVETTTLGLHTHTVAGMFDGPNHAKSALDALKAAGFTPGQISAVTKRERAGWQGTADTNLAGEDAAIGAAAGGVAIGLGAWLLGLSALTIPVVGEVVGLGMLWFALAGIGTGVVAGGLVGALVGQGLPEEHARAYEEQVRQGGLLVTIHASDDDQARQAREILDRFGATDARSYAREG